MSRILILEDDLERVRKFRAGLVGNEVEVVATSASAIHLLSTKDFDVVFLDHDLGGKVMQASGKETGYEVAKWLAANPDRQPPQIIVHSFNPAGAANMLSVLSDAVYEPGIWLRLGK